MTVTAPVLTDRLTLGDDNQSTGSVFSESQHSHAEGQRKQDQFDGDEERQSKGTGKPEPLKGGLIGWWSRRISQEDRMIYRVSRAGDGQSLEIAQLRLHY